MLVGEKRRHQNYYQLQQQFLCAANGQSEICLGIDADDFREVIYFRC